MDKKTTKEIQEVIIQEYRRFTKSDVLPIKNLDGKIKYDELFIKSSIGDLIKKNYFISICGVMNSGKSTLLNALIFDGERILPEDSTPETATITEIRYAEKPYAEIEYYSKKEWSSVLSGYKDSDIFQKKIEPVLREAEEKGIPTTVIREESFSESIDSLDNLQEYLAESGLHQYYVKTAVVYCPSPILKTFTFIDTPGTQDPNEIRSAITEKFIGRSSAVIMLLSKQINQTDIDFMEQFLKPIPKDKIITVLNKVDLVTNLEGVKEYVLNNLPQVVKNLVSETGVIGMCSLAAFLQKRIVRGLGLLDKEQWYIDKWKQNGLEKLLTSEGHLCTLEDAIEDKLRQRRGDIFSKHKNTILSLWDDKVVEIQQDIAEIQDDIEYYGRDERELTEKENELSSFLMAVTTEKKIMKDFITEMKSKCEEKIESMFEDSCMNAIKSLKDYIDTKWQQSGETKSSLNVIGRDRILKSIARSLNDELRVSVNEYFHPKNTKYDIHIQEFEKEIKDKTELFVNKYARELQSVKALNLWTNPYELSKEVRQLRELTGDIDFIEDLSYHWTLFTYDKLGSLDNLKKSISCFLKKIKKELFDRITGSIVIAWRDGINNWFSQLENVLLKRQERIGEIIKDLDNAVKRVTELRVNEKILEKKKERVLSIKNDVETILRDLYVDFE